MQSSHEAAIDRDFDERTRSDHHCWARKLAEEIIEAQEREIAAMHFHRLWRRG